jgi:hypothetical protein
MRELLVALLILVSAGLPGGCSKSGGMANGQPAGGEAVEVEEGPVLIPPANAREGKSGG